MIRGSAALLAFSAVLLAGCSSDEPAPQTLPPVASASPAESLPTPQASASGAEPVPVPLEAQAPDAFGASSFARFYFGRVNEAYRARDARPIRALSAPQCKSCELIAADVDRLLAGAISVGGSRYELSDVATAPALSDGSYIVDFRYSADAYVEQSEDGRIIRELPGRKSVSAQARLVRQDNAWRVSGLRDVS